MFLKSSLFVFPPAKSSNFLLVQLIIKSWIIFAPSVAPCSGLLIQHSHSKTAHTSQPYWVNLEKIVLKSIWPSPSDLYLPALSAQSRYPPKAPFLPVGLNSASFTWKDFINSW